MKQHTDEKPNLSLKVLLALVQSGKKTFPKHSISDTGRRLLLGGHVVGTGWENWVSGSFICSFLC